MMMTGTFSAKTSVTPLKTICDTNVVMEARRCRFDCNIRVTPKCCAGGAVECRCVAQSSEELWRTQNLDAVLGRAAFWFVIFLTQFLQFLEFLQFSIFELRPSCGACAFCRMDRCFECETANTRLTRPQCKSTNGVIDRSRQPEKRWMNQNGSRQGPARCSRIGGNRVTHFFPSSQMLTGRRFIGSAHERMPQNATVLHKLVTHLWWSWWVLMVQIEAW